MGRLLLHSSQLLIIFLAYFHYSNGCQIEGITLPWPIVTSILDTFRGTVIDLSTSQIDEITNVNYGAELNTGPYFDVRLENSRFVVSTISGFDEYERNETSQVVPITVNFRCSGGSSATLLIRINVNDTNNNAPEFNQTNLVYTITPPVAPGFEILGCLEFIVQDIDLTTQRLDFEVTDNPNFEITYDEASSTTAKQFKARLRTTTFIRNIREPITFTIAATDVDLTGDPRLTTTATVTILGSADFDLPDEPVFTEAFYLAEYTYDNQVILTEPISLRSGYDEFVDITLEGEFSSNFALVENENFVSIRVVTPLEINNILEKQLLLIVRATRKGTSGDTSTIILKLPEEVPLEFERAHYEGTIENNDLQVPPLVLHQGYEGASVSVIILNEYSSFFSAAVQGNTIILSMTSLNESVINENNFINLEVVANTDRSTATTIVTLQIIKDDNVTPVFNRRIYEGSYDPNVGLTLEQITLVQGYDDTVSISLEGDNKDYFEVLQNGPVISLNAINIPPEIFGEQRIVLSLEAKKPRTVGANAAIIIALPAINIEAISLGFDRVTYQGAIRNNVTDIQPITLIEGYTDDVTFSLHGVISSYFGLSRQGPVVNVVIQTPIPSALMPANGIIVLEIKASAPQAGTAYATIVFEVVVENEDSFEPRLVFDASYYTGTYNANDGLIFGTPITLSEGYDESVQFALEGGNAQWFSLQREQNSITLTQTNAIPAAVLTNNRQLIFFVTAQSSGSITARATIVIALTDDINEISIIGFDRVTYLGVIQNNATDINPITVSEGYTDDITFGLYGELSRYFGISREGSAVNVVLQTPLLAQNIPANRIIVLEIRASSPQAGTAHATIVFEVIMEDDTPSVIQLVFDAPYYTGSYNANDGLIVDSPISLSEGYDASVQFALKGDNARWFSLERAQNSVTLIQTNAIPGAVLTNNRQLVFVITAQRPGYATAQATIVITLTDDNTETLNLGFDRVTYQGSVKNNFTDIEPITLIEGYTDDVTFSLYGVLSNYFGLSRHGPVVNIVMQTPIPSALTPANRIIVLEIRASAPQAGTAHASIVFEVVVENEDSLEPRLEFDASYYTGTYNANDGLIFRTPITLSEGYDERVQFALEGENAQWFSLQREQNSVTLTQTNAIPAAVLTNNRQLVFFVTAQSPESVTARATIVISLTDDVTEISNIGFDRVTYLGVIQNNATDIKPITLSEGYTDDVTFGLYGEFSRYFGISREGSAVNIVIQTPLLAQDIPANRIIVLEIRASSPQAGTAHATIVFEVIMEDDTPSVIQLVFDAPYYTGSYNANDGLIVDSPIRLSEGYDASVQFALEGDNARWFSLERAQNSVTLIQTNAIPGAVLTNNRQLVFVITAQRPGYATAQATIVITLTDDNTETLKLGFDRVTYQGTVKNNFTDIEPITLIEGYTNDVTFSLYGVLSSYFGLSRQGPVVNIVMQTPIPSALTPVNRIIVLEIRASAPQAGTAHATIVFEVVLENEESLEPRLVFDASYYTGTYNANDGLIFGTPITLSEGYDARVQFALEGENAQWFSLLREQNSVTLTQTNAIPAAVLTNNRQLVFFVTAQSPESVTARATIVISLTDDITEISNIGFDRVTYLGVIQNNATDIKTITLSEGYTDDVIFGLYGEFSRYFGISREGSAVNVVLQTPLLAQDIPANRIIVLEIRASSPQAGTAHATIVFEVIMEDDAPSVIQLVFDAPYYTGSYNANDGLIIDSPISLSEGYDASVQFALEGDNARWFNLVQNLNSVILTQTSAIPGAILINNLHLIFFITAERAESVTARATIVISLTDSWQTGADVTFDKVLYNGIIQLDEIEHETILLSGYDGTNVDIVGEYASLFVGNVTNGVVTVQASGSMNLPADILQLPLELRAANAGAALILRVVQAGVPMLPTVTFTSETYILNVEIVHTGFLGRVTAVADNREAVVYSLDTNNTHLLSRLSINNEGELYLSAPANSGVYTFQVIATTVITQARGTAMVYLTVEAVTVCGVNDIVVPPLIVLDRDEEEPHNNLVILNSTHHAGCHFSLTNRWPSDQTWLYVDEYGLHTTAIDREHASIAFMALSQIQVELVLFCESDNNIRSKRSERTERLGPYDYGTNKWILTDSVPFNSRRSLVNLIVNDINDNAPIFVGKEHEPIAVGYPVEELVERILPRSLVELKAMDADIGENAALRYWSSESDLAVAPTTGFVHVRTNARLQDNQILTVNATDRRGEGLTGSIQLVVKLLNLNNIAVVTIRGAFLDDEINVLTRLSDALGYEVKTLRSVVLSDNTDEDVTRKNRETNTPGTVLQLYIYGLIERDPVVADRLIVDINNNAAVVNVVGSLSLEDHLGDSEITIVERDIGLLVATIVLSILLFVLILLIAIWFYLRWRKNKNYNEFSDENSLASKNESFEDQQKPDETMPRLNIEDLKKSERRLQEMLNSPIEEVTVEPMTKQETPVEAILDLPLTEPNAPIVIQSIDKLKDAEESDDEFGERKEKRRKSVVTFNENVEKIIHVEDLDDTDDNSSEHSSYEIYRL